MGIDSPQGANKESRAAYTSSRQLAEDVLVLRDVIAGLPGSHELCPRTESWQTQIDTFGLHLATTRCAAEREDLCRGHGRNLHEVRTPHVTRFAGRGGSLSSVDRFHRSASLACQAAVLAADPGIAQPVRAHLHQVTASFSLEAIGAHVISMTSSVSDVLTVLWLWKQTCQEQTKVTEGATIQGARTSPSAQGFQLCHCWKRFTTSSREPRS